MFEKTLTITSRTIYCLTVGAGVIWLLWLCFGHLPFWIALFVFPLAFVLAAMAGAPLAAGAAFAGGLVAASIAWSCSRISRLLSSFA